MKMIKYIGGCVLAGLLLTFVSCDTIKEQDRKVLFTGSISGERTVLLEEFTGVRCVNCPIAANEAHKLQEFFGENLIVVSLFPQTPTGLTDIAPGDPDVRTEEAEAYAREFNVDQFPNGMVNRQSVLAWESWGGAVAEVVSGGDNYASMTMSVALDEEELQVSLSGRFEQEYKSAGVINVIVMVLGDSIVTRQLGATNPAAHVQNHVLITTLSDVWGDRVASSSPSAGTEFSAAYHTSIDPLLLELRDNKKLSVDKLTVVAALVDAGSKEVLQAVQVHLKK